MRHKKPARPPGLASPPASYSVSRPRGHVRAFIDMVKQFHSLAHLAYMIESRRVPPFFGTSVFFARSVAYSFYVGSIVLVLPVAGLAVIFGAASSLIGIFKRKGVTDETDNDDSFCVYCRGLGCGMCQQ